MTAGLKAEKEEQYPAYLQRAYAFLKNAPGHNTRKAGRRKGSVSATAKGAGKGADKGRDLTPMQAALFLTGGNEPRAKTVVVILKEHGAAFDTFAASVLSS